MFGNRLYSRRNSCMFIRSFPFFLRLAYVWLVVSASSMPWRSFMTRREASGAQAVMHLLLALLPLWSSQSGSGFSLRFVECACCGVHG